MLKNCAETWIHHYMQSLSLDAYTETEHFKSDNIVTTK